MTRIKQGLAGCCSTVPFTRASRHYPCRALPCGTTLMRTPATLRLLAWRANRRACSKHYAEQRSGHAIHNLAGVSPILALGLFRRYADDHALYPRAEGQAVAL